MLTILKKRFADNPSRHPAVAWSEVERRLAHNPDALKALRRMEESGGEPDVVDLGEGGTLLTFCDCAQESPTGRRSLCYDGEALRGRKRFPPGGSAVEQARAFGTELLTEAQYRVLQTLGEFDLKTSSWVATPDDIRQRGGALFCERRYEAVFTFHNGADSYYAARGWRGFLRV